MAKKLLICLLSVAMLLSFWGCGRNTDIRGEVSANTTASTQPETTEAPTEATTEATTEPTEAEFSIGSATGNTYKNEFIGIQCTLDANWTFKTDEEMRAINEESIGMVGDDYKAMLASAAVIQDMFATYADQMSTVNVVLEKIGVANLLMTEEQYLAVAKDPAVEALSSMGLNITSAEVTTMQFAGKEHAALIVEADIGGIAMYEYIVVVKCSGYIACITACTWFENGCVDILNQFEPC